MKKQIILTFKIPIFLAITVKIFFPCWNRVLSIMVMLKTQKHIMVNMTENTVCAQIFTFIDFTL